MAHVVISFSHVTQIENEANMPDRGGPVGEPNKASKRHNGQPPMTPSNSTGDPQEVQATDDKPTKTESEQESIARMLEQKMTEAAKNQTMAKQAMASQT